MKPGARVVFVVETESIRRKADGRGEVRGADGTVMAYAEIGTTARFVRTERPDDFPEMDDDPTRYLLVSLGVDDLGEILCWMEPTDVVELPPEPRRGRSRA